jgi:hypothetical protein
MRRIFSLLLIIFLVASSTSITLTKAQGRTIIVPDNYSTIQSAIANAVNGDTIFFRDGTYEGPINQTLVIDKQLSIVGQSADNTVIKLRPAYNESWIFATAFYDYSDAIAINADNFKLYNLKILIQNPGGTISAKGNGLQIIGTNITTGPSTGIEITGSYCKVINNTIFGSVTINGTFNEVAGNSPLNYIYTYSSFNLIRNNTCGVLGVCNSTNNVFLENKMWTNTRSYSGVDIIWSNYNFFYKNQISGYSSGFRFWFSNGNIIVGNTVADSLTSLNFGGSSGNMIHHNNFIDNPSWVREYIVDQYRDRNFRNAYPNVTVSVNTWDNGLNGNFWGNYNGTDSNGDGVGDTPYIINVISYDLNQSKTEIFCGQDNFPFMSMVNTDNIAIDLPAWVSNLPPDNQAIDLQIPPTLKETDSATPAMNPSVELPTTSIQQEPKSNKENHTMTVAMVFAALTCVIAGLSVYFRKYKPVRTA